MKDTIKAVGLFIVGLVVAVIVYPIMHEVAHSIVAIAVGMSGMLLPYFLSVVFKPKNFWLWYANYIVKGISALAFVISTISTACFFMGAPLPNDDTTQILAVWPNGKWICLLLSISLAVLAIARLIREKPFIQCMRCFNIPVKKTASAA